MLRVTLIAETTTYGEIAEHGRTAMTKLIPIRRCHTEAKHRPSTRAALVHLSDWTLRDIGIFRSAPRLDSVKPFWMA